MEHSTNEITSIVCKAYANLHSESLIEASNCSSREEFFEEFRRIIIGVPRRSGKTRAALELLYTFPNSLIINTLGHNYPRDNPRITHINKITEASFRGAKLDLVIIDNMKRLTMQQVNKLYQDINFTSKLVVELL